MNSLAEDLFLLLTIPREDMVCFKIQVNSFQQKSVINLMRICFATRDKLDAAILQCNSDTNYSELVHTPYVKYMCVHTCVLSCFSHVPFFVTLQIVARQTSLFMEDSPAKITGVGCHALLQGIFLTQGSNPGLLCLLQWQAVSLPPGKPYVKGIILQKTTLTSDVSCKFRGLQLPALTTSWLKIQGFHDHLRFNNLLE